MKTKHKTFVMELPEPKHTKKAQAMLDAFNMKPSARFYAWCDKTKRMGIIPTLTTSDSRAKKRALDRVLLYLDWECRSGKHVHY